MKDNVFSDKIRMDINYEVLISVSVYTTFSTCTHFLRFFCDILSQNYGPYGSTMSLVINNLS